MENIEINTEELLGKIPNQAKRYVNNKLKEHKIRKIYSAAEEKSKVRDYICNKTRTAMMIRPPYMDRYNRKDCTNIFNTRARMIYVKCNYKGKYRNLTCRWCNQTQEMQQHILKNCPHSGP